MAMELVWTRYGRVAGEALRAAIADAKGGDALAPVTVIVPSNHVGVATRRLLASGVLGPVAGAGIGLAAVSFLTPYRLAELLGSAPLAATGRRPVSTPVLAAATRAVLSRGAGLFEPVKEHPATEGALVTTYQELRDLTPRALDSLTRVGGRAAEVVRIHRATRARLEDEWSDEQDLVTSAIAAVTSHPSSAEELGAVIVYLPQRVTLHAAALIRALAERGRTMVLAGTTGHSDADAEVLASVGRLGLDPTGPLADRHLPVSPDRTTIVTTSDGDEEVRAAVREVVDAARAGTRLDRIAVLHTSPDPYARLTHEHLDAAGIATNGASIVPLASRMAGRTLLDMLALAEHGFRRQDVFTWLASAPMRFEGSWTPTTAWERISRQASVVAGSDWQLRLDELIDLERRRIDRYRSSDEELESEIERAERTLAHAQGLQRFVTHHIADLSEAVAAPRAWAAHAAWALEHLNRLLGPAGQRARWPVAEQKAADQVERSLLRLGALDGLEPPVTLDVFHRTLEVELESDLGRTGRFGEGVLVGSVEMGVGLDLDLVIVLGLAEGSFPAPVRDDSLLPDRERATTGGELPLRSERVERQHRDLLATLAGARRQVLCVPRGDLRRSVERVPSRWVLDIASHLDGGGDGWWAKDLYAATVPWVRHIGSFHDGLRQLEVPATAQEHRLIALDAGGGDIAASADPRLRAAAEVVSLRRSAGFTRFDGNLAGVEVTSPLTGTMSPTTLERWASCPHRFLVENLLGAAPVENPEEELSITPMEKGNLVHDALERFVAEVLEAGGIGFGEPWTSEQRRRALEIAVEVCDDAERRGITGRAIFWRRERRKILREVDAAITFDNEQRAIHGTAPRAVEFSFGRDGAAPVAIPLPDGRAVLMRGRADRLDLAADGTIHVIDYKTGKSKDFRPLGESDPTLTGRKLQLPVYGLAGRMRLGDPAAPIHAAFWFIGADRRAVGYPVTDEVLTATSEVLGWVTTGIESGVFPPHPDDHASSRPRAYVSCRTCDPDGLGVTELRRAWEAKRSDAVLATYAERAEPAEEAS